MIKNWNEKLYPPLCQEVSANEIEKYLKAFPQEDLAEIIIEVLCSQTKAYELIKSFVNSPD